MKYFSHFDGNVPSEIFKFLEEKCTQKFETEKEKADYIKELYAKACDFLETKNLQVSKENIDAHFEAIKVHVILPKTEAKKPCGCQEHAPVTETKCYERPCFWFVLGITVLVTALTTYAITDYFKDSK